MVLTLTPLQHRVCSFLTEYIREHGYAPSHEEIREHIGFKSRTSVHKVLKRLQERGYLNLPPSNKKRALELVPFETRSVSIPFVGIVAAGTPVEAVEIPEMVEIPENLLGKGTNIALKVRGDSMIEDGIRDGDTLIVTKGIQVENGWTVVAMINDEATVKRYYRREDMVELRPANKAMAPILVKASEVDLVGVVVGLVRLYRPNLR